MQSSAEECNKNQKRNDRFRQITYNPPSSTPHIIFCQKPVIDTPHYLFIKVRDPLPDQLLTKIRCDILFKPWEAHDPRYCCKKDGAEMGL